MSLFLRVSTIVFTLIVFLGVGVLVGRSASPHNFEPFNTTGYLYDASTGTFCRAFPPTVKNADGFDMANPSREDQIRADPNHIPPCPTSK